MSNPKLLVEIVGDNRKLRKAQAESLTGTKQWAAKLEGIQAGTALGGRGGLGSSAALLKGGGIALGAGIAAQKVRELTQAASDLNEQQTKSQAVFGKSAESIADWSDTTAKALGISKRASLEASGTFGNLFSTVGIVGDNAALMSKQLVGLASDLASFNNADPSDVLDAIRSGLIGEAEPLRRFGVLLSETRVQQQAMADTGKTTAKSLTAQDKATARYKIILADTTKAQGDFARTSDGLANKQRILAANTEDLQGKLGKGLLPVMIELTGIASDAAETASLLADKYHDLGISFDFPTKNGKILGHTFKDFVTFYPILNDVLGGTKKGVDDVGESLKNASSAAQGFQVALVGLSGGTFGVTPLDPTLGKKPVAAGSGVTADQRNQWFDSDITRRLDKVQDIATIKGQISALKDIEGLIEQRLNVTKDITRRLSLEDQLRAVRRQEGSLGDQARQDAADAKEAARAAAERLKAAQQEAAATRLQQRTARQFRELGLTATGDEVTPGVQNLKKRVASVADRISGTKLDTPKLHTELARFRKVLAEGLVPKDVRAKIKQMLDDINQELNQNAKQGGPLTKTTQLNSDRILSGLGLGPEAERKLRARLSHFNSAGKALAGSGSGSRTIVVQPPDVHLDGRKISQNTSKHQARKRNAGSVPRNGPNAGIVIN